MSRRWQEMLAWVAGVVVPLLVLTTVFITVLELERIPLHHLAHVSQLGVSKAGGTLQGLSTELGAQIADCGAFQPPYRPMIARARPLTALPTRNQVSAIHQAMKVMQS
jgi:hypothetical protein